MFKDHMHTFLLRKLSTAYCSTGTLSWMCVFYRTHIFIIQRDQILFFFRILFFFCILNMVGSQRDGIYIYIYIHTNLNSGGTAFCYNRHKNMHTIIFPLFMWESDLAYSFLFYFIKHHYFYLFLLN